MFRLTLLPGAAFTPRVVLGLALLLLSPASCFVPLVLRPFVWVGLIDVALRERVVALFVPVVPLLLVALFVPVVPLREATLFTLFDTEVPSVVVEREATLFPRDATMRLRPRCEVAVTPGRILGGKTESVEVSSVKFL